jgi:hypothetical protein
MMKSLNLESRSYSDYISRVNKLKHPFLIGTIIFSVILICLFLFFKPSRQPNIIFVPVDALRANHLGSYGHERDTTSYYLSLKVKKVISLIF